MTRRSPPEAVDGDEERAFAGVYVPHWEVARFCVVTGRRFFGLLPRVERWRVVRFPDGFALRAWSDPSTFRESRGRAYRMTVVGRVGPRGRFGHKGICSRELHVVRVVSCEETTAPGPTW